MGHARTSQRRHTVYGVLSIRREAPGMLKTEDKGIVIIKQGDIENWKVEGQGWYCELRIHPCELCGKFPQFPLEDLADRGFGQGLYEMHLARSLER